MDTLKKTSSEENNIVLTIGQRSKLDNSVGSKLKVRLAQEFVFKDHDLPLNIR